jgi:hypothetical protein
MSQPASDQNEPSKMKKIMNGDMDESIRTRLPRANGPNGTTSIQSITPISSPPEPRRSRYKFMPAFWTIASVISLTVNIILIIILLITFQMFSAILTTSDEKITGLLGGLYTNFVKMDQATIATNIPVDATVPLNIVVPVQATTRITLAESVVIPNAHVRINTGGLSIDADAVVTLPADTALTVNLDFPLNVQDSIPVHLDVPVNIPLDQTELHEPFVGLQQVVKPWYCLIEPSAMVDGGEVCSPISNPAPTEPASP